MSRHQCSILIFVTDVSRQLHRTVIHLTTHVIHRWQASLTLTELPLSANNEQLFLEPEWALSQ